MRFSMNDRFMHRLFQAFDNLTYGILSILGCYFIHKGGVLERFSAQKTFFAEYSEPVTELPSLLTYIDSSIRGDLKYGTDFNITFTYNGYQTKLKLGKNYVGGAKPDRLELDLEALWDETVFRITPQNFPTYVTTQQAMFYTFNQPSAIKKVNLQLTTKTGGALDGQASTLEGGIFNSNEEVFKVGIKEMATVTFWPEKRIFLKSKGCHPDPVDSSNYIQIQEAIKDLEHKNFTVCKPARRSFGTLLNNLLRYLPDCKSFRDLLRFNMALGLARFKALSTNP